jgi:hypothetical protein
MKKAFLLKKGTLLKNHKTTIGGSIHSNNIVRQRVMDRTNINRIKLESPLDYTSEKNLRADVINIGGRLNRINFTPTNNKSGLIRTLF